MDRRTFVGTMCLGGLATFAWPSVSFARLPGRSRLVFVLLRGGVDGLAAVVPYGDPAYRALRGPFAFGAGELTPLDDVFGLAPGLAPLRDLWQQNELVAIHAMAIPFRTRSHFDGQAILETGLSTPAGSADGWLNRLLQTMDGRRSGIAIAAGMPRSLQGPYEIETWSPAKLGATDDAFLERLATLYRRDPVLHGRFETALQAASLVGEEPAAGAGPRRGGDRSDHAGGGADPRRRRSERGGDGVQRVGHPCQSGRGRRRARPPARPARRGPRRVSDRDGRGMVDDHRGGDDRVRPHRARQRHTRHRSRHRRGRAGDRPAAWRVPPWWPTGPGCRTRRSSRDAI